MNNGNNASERNDSDMRYLQIIEESADGIVIVDKTGKALFANPMAKQLLQRESHEIIGSLFGFPLHEADSTELQIPQKDGSIKYVELRAVKSHWKREVAFICNLRDITNRKTIEKNLRQSEHKYRSLYNSIRDAILVANTNREIIDCNTAFTELFQYEFSEIKRKKTSHIYNSMLEYQKMGNAIRKHRGDPKLLFNVHYKKKNGEVFLGETNVFYMHDDNGNVNGFLGLIRDITEKKKAEKKFRESLEEIELITVNIPNIIWKADVDKNGNFLKTYISEVVNEFLGLPAGTIDNKWEKYFSYVKNEYLAETKEAIKQCVEHPGKTISTEYEVVKANGKTAWFLSSGRAYYKNDQIQIFGYTTDITDRKNTEKALRESYKRIQTIGNNLPSGMIYRKRMKKGEKPEFTYVSDKVKQLHGCTPEEAINDSDRIYNNVLEEDSKLLYKERRRAMEELTPYSIEIRVQRPNGDIRWHQVISQPRKQGDYYIFDGIEFDISNRKQAEEEHEAISKKLAKQNEDYEAINEELNQSNEQLQQLNKDLEEAKEKAEESDRLKSAFLANMSHEIRTPMNAIMGFAGLLNEENLSIDKQRKYLKIIQNKGDDLLQLINDIIDIAKIEAGYLKLRYEVINLNEFLNQIFSNYHDIIHYKGKSNKVKLLLNKSLPNEKVTIHTDPVRLRQILANLLNNSIKFTHEGKIEFGYKTPSSGKLMMYVSDTGIGIPEDKQNRVFDRFRQIEDELNPTNFYGGTGLGLNIVKNLISMLEGEIWLESSEQSGNNKGGTSFYFTIPYNPSPLAEKPAAKKAVLSLPNWSDKTILIAEDETSNLDYLVEALKSTGTQILIAKNGKQCIEVFTKNPSIDLILMDIKMPVMDGYTATREIRKLNENVIIIAQTAYALSGDKEKALAAGCDSYLTKPIRKQELLELAGSLLK